jgi:hypothetical protein
LPVKFCEIHLFNPDHEYILAGDETIVSKNGSRTFGIDRFYSSWCGQVIRSLGFLVFSIVSVTECQAYPLMCEQRIKEKPPESPPKVKKQKRARRESNHQLLCRSVLASRVCRAVESSDYCQIGFPEKENGTRHFVQ